MSHDDLSIREAAHSPQPEQQDERAAESSHGNHPPPYTPSSLHGPGVEPSAAGAEDRVPARTVVTSADIQSKLKPILATNASSENRLLQIKRKLLSGSDAWLSDQVLYREWLEGSAPFVWLRGNPGFGKTFLCGSVISTLQTRATNESFSVAYFFFRDTETKTRSFLTALKSLALQISQADYNYGLYLYESDIDDEDIDSIASAWRLLYLDYFVHGPASRPVYLILDGIDEALDQDRVEFLQQLVDLSKPAHEQPSNDREKLPRSRLKVLLAGRPHIADDFRGIFEEAVPAVQLTKKSNAPAIKAYLEAKVNTLPSLHTLSAERRNEIIDAIKDRADGMFLWCDLMLTQLSQITRNAEVTKCLANPPPTLDAMISRVLTDIATNVKTESEARDLSETIMWVMVCEDPPSLWDLNMILSSASEDNEPPLDWEAQLRTKYACFFSLSTNFLTAEDQESEEVIAKHRPHPERPPAERRQVDWSPNLWLGNTSVSFCHAYIGEYFRKSQRIGSRFPIGVDSTHAELQGLSRAGHVIWCSEYSDLDLGWLQFRIVSLWKDLLIRSSRGLPHYGTSEKAAAGKDMVSMFRDDKIVGKTRFGLNELPGSKEVVRALQKWYGDKDVYESLDEGVKAWALASVAKPSVFFSRHTEIFAQKWLKSPSAAAYRNIHRFNFIKQVGNLEAREGSAAASSVDWDNVERVAESFGFEQDSTWHWAVGLVLQFLKRHILALPHFEVAHRLQPTQPFITDDLASTYHVVGEYEESLQMREQAITLFLEQTEGPIGERVIQSDNNLRKLTLAGLKVNAARTQLKLGRDDSVRKAFEEALGIAEDASICFSAYVKLLNRQQDHRQILRATENLGANASQRSEEELTGIRGRLFANLTSDFELHEIILDTAERYNRMEWLEAVYLRAISDSQSMRYKLHITGLHFNLALFYERVGIAPKAASEWQAAMQEPGSPIFLVGPKTWLHWSIWHLNNALRLDAEGSSVAAQRHVSALEQLWARRGEAPEKALGNFQVVALHLARWRISRGNDEPGGRELARSVLEWALDVESSTSRPGTKFTDSFITQCLALLQDNARVAAQVHSDVPRVSRREVQEEEMEVGAGWADSVEGMPKQSRWRWFCRGGCRSDDAGFPIDEALHLCRLCEACFCDKCVAVLRAGRSLKESEVERSWEHGCTPLHDWIRVPPVPRIAVPKGMMVYDGRVVKADEFVRDMRRAHGV